NGDGQLDLITANNDDNDVAVLLGDGQGGFAPAPGSPFPVGPSPYPLAVGDVNGDGKPDIITPNSKPGERTVTVLLGDGRGGFQPARGSPFAAAGRPYYIALGDVNGDGKPDLVVPHADDSRVTVLLGDGKGGFAPAPGSPVDLGSRAWAVAVADINGDGQADLVAATGEGVRVMLGDGRGSFKAAPGSPFAAGGGAGRLKARGRAAGGGGGGAGGVGGGARGGGGRPGGRPGGGGAERRPRCGGPRAPAGACPAPPPVWAWAEHPPPPTPPLHLT